MLTDMRVQEPRKPAIPEDLSGGLDKNAFLGLIYEAVHSVEWPKEPSVRPGEDRLPPAVLRTLLTYCYATGIYSSREIEYAALDDRMVRYICAYQRPSWPVIRQFRRQNMPWIRQAVSKACSLVTAKNEESREPFYRDWSIRRWGTPIAPDFSQEAEARIRRAIQADSMALDE